MSPAAIVPTPARWRLRAGVGAAAAFGVLAIAGGMSAGLNSSAGWTNDAHAAVIPEVLYLEEDVALTRTIARVNGDIGREVSVDRVDELSRRATSAARTGTANTVMATDADAEDTNGNDGQAKDEAADATDRGTGTGTGTGVAEAPATDRPTPPKPADPGPAPKPDEPAPTPTPTPTPTPEPAPEPEPTRGNGTPQNDNPRAPERDPKVDGKSGDTTAKETTTP